MIAATLSIEYSGEASEQAVPELERMVEANYVVQLTVDGQDRDWQLFRIGRDRFGERELWVRNPTNPNTTNEVDHIPLSFIEKVYVY